MVTTLELGRNCNAPILKVGVSCMDAISNENVRCTAVCMVPAACCGAPPAVGVDRKSTRLNSSHLGISYAVFCLTRLSSRVTLFPYTTLFRSGLWLLRRSESHGHDFGARSQLQRAHFEGRCQLHGRDLERERQVHSSVHGAGSLLRCASSGWCRSEEHTSELQSLRHLVCRLLLDSSIFACYTLSLHDALPIWAVAVETERVAWSRLWSSVATATRPF